MVKSMTEGNPLRLIVNFAIPLLLGNLFQQTYNMVDAIIVGQYLGPDALAGVGASSSVQFLILGFCTGSCAGFAIPVAQEFGAKAYDRMRSYIFHAVLLTMAIGVIMTTVCGVFCSNIMYLMKTPDKIYDDAYIYLFIIFMGIPFTLLYNLLAGILRAVGDSKSPFLFLVLSTILNIGLDCLFIMVFGLGCAGAALATILSQAVSGILCLILIYKKFELLQLKKSDMYVNTRYLYRSLFMGIPMGLQYSITAIGSMVLQSANNSLGSVYISGFTAGSKIKQFAMCPFDAFATAVANFCSQNLGAEKYGRMKRGIVIGTTISVSYGIFIGLILNLFGYNLSMLFVNMDQVDVLKASAKYVGRLGLFFWALGFLNVSRLTIQGIGYAGLSILSGVFEMIARITVSLVFVPKFGFNAICFADQSAWIAAILYCVPLLWVLVNRLERRSGWNKF
jgi:putative MATE family efflux protein